MVLQELTGEPLPPPVAAPTPAADAPLADAPSSPDAPSIVATNAPEIVEPSLGTTDRSAPSPSPSESSPSTAPIGGIIAAVIGACLCILIGFLLWRRRRSKHHLMQPAWLSGNDPQRCDSAAKVCPTNRQYCSMSLTLVCSCMPKLAVDRMVKDLEMYGCQLWVAMLWDVLQTGGSIQSGYYTLTHPSSHGVGLASSLGSLKRHPSSASSLPRQPLGVQPGMPSRFGQTTHWDTFCATRDPSQPSGTRTMTPGQPPPKDAHISDRLEFLHGQLDSFGVNDVLLGRFSLLGYSYRRQGGV